MINLIEKIQQNLGMPALQKIDPNTQEVKRPENVQDELGQSAIPTVLLGLYKYSRGVEGNAAILNKTGDKMLHTIFGSRENEVVSAISSYTGNDIAYTQQQMEAIAEEAASVIRENGNGEVTGESVKTLLTDQRHEILVHLPAGLQIGEVLGDDTIDDRTNKMEGPVSGHMHWLEKLFSSSPPKAKDEEKKDW